MRRTKSNPGGRQYLRLVPAALVMGIIFCLSHQEGSSLSLPAIPYIDKLGHFLLYAVLAGTVLFAVPAALRQGYPQGTAAAVIVFCMVYGMTDELHQAFIPGREASISDLGADLLGASLMIYLRYRPRSSEPFLFISSLLSGGIKPHK